MKLDTDETAPIQEAVPNPSARRLAAYLRERTRADGECYFKSKFVAEDVDLSAKQVGAYMRQLQDEKTGLHIEKWGYTNATTWRVRPASSAAEE